MTDLTPRKSSGSRFGWLPDRPNKQDYKLADHFATLTRKPDINKPLIECPRFNEKVPRRDQGNLGSCGPNTVDEIFCYVRGVSPRSRLQIYYETRRLEDTIEEDSGVYNRDLMKVLSTLGAGRESWWSYDDGPDKFRQDPIEKVDRDALKRKIADYYRLDNDQHNSTDCKNQMELCLAEGFPFMCGATLYTRFVDGSIDGHGIVSMPNLSTEKEEGGHDFTIWGRHLEFQSHPWAIWAMNNGLNRNLVPDQVYIARNHWRNWGLPDVPELGEFRHWGNMSNFVIPMDYVQDGDLADDQWTFRNVKPPATPAQ
jgi:hypothetical protein